MAITAEHITYTIDKRTIVRDVSLTCAPQKLIALVGPSGSGKTTLLSILGLMITPTSGTLTAGHYRKWNAHRRRAFWKESAAFIYQDYGLIDEENVIYNITLQHRKLRGMSADRQQELQAILAQVGLSGREQDSAMILSGGEKQRVGIARALWKHATYIFADEPTASLDEANKEQIYQLLRGAVTKGACVIVATHDQDLMRHCDQVLDLGAAS